MDMSMSGLARAARDDGRLEEARTLYQAAHHATDDPSEAVDHATSAAWMAFEMGDYETSLTELERLHSLGWLRVASKLNDVNEALRRRERLKAAAVEAKELLEAQRGARQPSSTPLSTPTNLSTKPGVTFAALPAAKTAEKPRPPRSRRCVWLAAVLVALLGVSIAIHVGTTSAQLSMMSGGLLETSTVGGPATGATRSARAEQKKKTPKARRKGAASKSDKPSVFEWASGLVETEAAAAATEAAEAVAMLRELPESVKVSMRSVSLANVSIASLASDVARLAAPLKEISLEDVNVASVSSWMARKASAAVSSALKRLVVGLLLLLLLLLVARFVLRPASRRTVSGSASPAVPTTLASVDAPTPSQLWFSPAAGWADAGVWARSVEEATPKRKGFLGLDGEMPKLSKLPPPGLMPTALEAPCFHGGGGAIGEVWLEVLAATGLRKTDLVSGTDAYAVVLLEGTMGRSCTVFDTESPEWPSYAPRAFVLPVAHPCSVLHVGLFDDDGSSAVDEDDELGRVRVPLAGLRAGVTYDCWYPLQRESYRRHAGSQGSLRLRFSLRLHVSPRQRLQLSRGSPPSSTIPLQTRHDTLLAKFMLQGKPSEETFNIDVLLAQISELIGLTYLPFDLIDAIYSLMLYRRWRRSLLAAIGWQLACWRPHLLPSIILLTLSFNLYDSYRASPSCRGSPVLRPHSLLEMVGCLLGTGHPNGAPPSIQAILDPNEDDGDASDDEVKPPTDEEAWAAVVASLEVEVREAASQRAEDEAEARKAPKSKKGIELDAAAEQVASIPSHCLPYRPTPFDAASVPPMPPRSIPCRPAPSHAAPLPPMPPRSLPYRPAPPHAAPVPPHPTRD